MIGGVIGGAATALAASLYWMGGDDTATADLESRLAAAEQQVGQLDALNQRVAAIETAPPTVEDGGALAARLGELETTVAALGEAPAGGGDQGLGDRLDTLEQQVGTLDYEQQIAALEQRVETQQSNLQALSTLTDSTLPTLELALAATGKSLEETGAETTTLKETVGTLAGDVQTLATRVGDTEGRLDHLGGEYQRGAAMIVAIGDIDRAISKAEPFASSLQSLTSLLRDETVLGETLSTLEPMAAEGVPTLSALKGAFGDMASRVLLAENGDRSLTDQVSDNVFGIFNMRPAGAEVEGSDSRAVLARAQAKLSADDLEGAITELTGLEGAAAEQANAWVERAQARLAAAAAVADLRSHAQGLVAKGS
ncbi:MAG: mitofilin family membrane protein [Alphaproteobacteria bacterium]|nr:mitofilin family membrane protein [Alphaproteobacteria bacterium]